MLFFELNAIWIVECFVSKIGSNIAFNSSSKYNCLLKIFQSAINALKRGYSGTIKKTSILLTNH